MEQKKHRFSKQKENFSVWKNEGKNKIVQISQKTAQILNWNQLVYIYIGK